MEVTGLEAFGEPVADGDGESSAEDTSGRRIPVWSVSG
jgi:hypothetical protein